jgi:hypothetical protein
MIKTKLITLFIILLTATAVFSQTKDDLEIRQLARKVVLALQQNDFENIKEHFPVREDFAYILNLSKDSMPENEYEKLKALLDTLPFKFENEIKRAFDKANEMAIEYAIDWKEIEYLDTEIIYKQEKDIGLLTAKIIAKLAYNSEEYRINFECGKLPRSWIIGTKFKFRKIL